MAAQIGVCVYMQNLVIDERDKVLVIDKHERGGYSEAEEIIKVNK